MTNQADILGRPPARKPRPEPDNRLPDTDWRGEHHWRVKPSPNGGGNFNVSSAVRKAEKSRKANQ